MQTVNFAGSSYNIPNTRGDRPWSGLSDFVIAAASKAINTAGGNFTLLADINFGATYGLVSTYYKSRTASIATVGVLRLANVTDSVSWRNALGDGNLSLTANAANQLQFNSKAVPLEAGALTASRAVVSDASAIPDLVSSVTSTTELSYVSGVTSAIQTQLNAKQASGNYITALTGGVTASGPGSAAATVVTNANLTGVITSVGNATSIASQTGTGTKFVVDTSPQLVTPLLGTPTSGVLTNCTGTASGLTAGTVTTNANLTGVITSSGNATSIASQTGTGTKFVVDNTPTLVTPVLGAATATSITFSPTTGGIVGTTTNDAAGAGKVGEYASVGSPTGGTATPGLTDAFVNITSMTLTAGDWDVWGTARFDTGGTFAGTRYDIGVSLTSAAADSTSSGGYIRDYIAIGGTFIRLFSTGTRRISLSGSATVYLVGSLTYTTLGATTWSSNSILMARRVR